MTRKPKSPRATDEKLSRRTALASSATPPVPVSACDDPVLAVIDRHRELSARLDEATAVSSKLHEGPEFDAADEISGERHSVLKEHAKVLVQSKPRTIAGIIVLSRYVASLGASQLPDDERWHQVVLETLAAAIEESEPVATGHRTSPV
ncbi:hypothetical protein [Bradyrhizobium iriomotense]|uniref:Uncharacterized protein n=1 Tax=Bradyrhizobium iriomotense TaxID=441950 RepID=A0ABQ6B2J3_9BRAD|nr:hypothetical protein [Bradyrhizobium iriomotense]GLR87691.1 hypothetical protein GCM10007857_44020 [Bradyrhizobium iriomotense]